MKECAPRRLRVLLSCFAIAPNQGSEPGVGWNVATRLAKYHDVTVLCGDLGGGRQTESDLKDYFHHHGSIPGLEVCYVPPSALTEVIHWIHQRPGLWFVYYSAYKMWQRKAYARAITLHAHKSFDIVHQLTFASYREPGYLWRLPAPFFWGPIGGATSPPLNMSLQIGGWRFLIRHVGNILQRRFSRRSVLAARKASCTWVATEDDRDLIEKWGGQVKQQCQVGTAVISSIPHIQRKAGEFRLVWSGQHIPGKALALALETMARLQKKPGYHLDILGTGPLTSKCQSLSKRLGIEHLITWHGRLAQPDAIAVMSKAHALLHTSISEGTPAVVLEALALGLPVICHDACGMQTAITEHCGVKVRLHDRETSVNGFRAAIEEVADDCVYHALSAGAIDRARELTWDKKVASIAAAYASVSGCHRS